MAKKRKKKLKVFELKFDESVKIKVVIIDKPIMEWTIKP